MAETERIVVVPDGFIWHDKEKYTVEIELPGVHKKDIDFEATESAFCIKAIRDDIEYIGCWILAHTVDPEKAKASFQNGLLKVTVPLTEELEGIKVPID